MKRRRYTVIRWESVWEQEKNEQGWTVHLFDPSASCEQLNRLASEGWRVVCAVDDKLILELEEDGPPYR